MAKCKTVDVSLMPHNVLKDFLNGDLSFDEEKQIKKDIVTLSVRK
jgi:hypothetical protein